MIAGEDGAGGGAAVRPVEQSGAKVIAATGDLEANRNLLAVDGSATLPRTGNDTLPGALSDGRDN
jgi:hypothetical protein